MSIEQIILEDMEQEAIEDVVYGDDADLIDHVLKSNDMDKEDDGVYPGRKIKVPPEIEELEILDLQYSEEELEHIDDGLGNLEDELSEDDTKSELEEYFDDEDEDEYIAGEEDELHDLFSAMDTLLEEDEE